MIILAGLKYPEWVTGQSSSLPGLPTLPKTIYIGHICLSASYKKLFYCVAPERSGKMNSALTQRMAKKDEKTMPKLYSGHPIIETNYTKGGIITSWNYAKNLPVK